MSEERSRVEEVERSMDATRGRMAATVAELDEAVAARVDAAKERVDVRRLIVDHPWPSLLFALGAGILLARSGADERAARAAADAARRAPSATKRRAKRAAAAARDAARRRGTDESSLEEVAAVDAGFEDAGDDSTRPQGLAMRVSKALHGDELLDDMRGEADRIAGTPPGRTDADRHQI